MNRYIEPDRIEAAARKALASDSYVAIHQKSPNVITETLKIRSVNSDSITFNRAALGLPDITLKIDDLRYLEA